MLMLMVVMSVCQKIDCPSLPLNVLFHHHVPRLKLPCWGKKIHHFQTHPGHLRKEEPQHVGFPAPKSDESKTRFNDKNLLGPFTPMATKVNGERHFCTWRASLYLGPMGGGIWRYWGPSVANKYGGFNTERGEYLKTTWSPSQGSGDLGCINLSLRLHM